MTRQEFNELDLRTQLTDELKKTWYYQERKWGLRINKHSVVFDNCFEFELKYVEAIIDDKDGSVICPGICLVQEDGETKYTLCDADAIYDDEEKQYNRASKHILEDIIIYIANCI